MSTCWRVPFLDGDVSQQLWVVSALCVVGEMGLIDDHPKSENASRFSRQPTAGIMEFAARGQCFMQGTFANCTGDYQRKRLVRLQILPLGGYQCVSSSWA